MKRGFGHFEIKETKEGKEIRPDNQNNKNYTKKSNTNHEDTEKIGFDDFQSNIKIDKDYKKFTKLHDETIDTLIEEYASIVADCENQETIQSVIKSGLSTIYNDMLLKYCNVTFEEMVDEYFKFNEFDGLESYYDLISNVNDAIILLRKTDLKNNQTYTKDNTQNNTVDMLKSAVNATEQSVSFSDINNQMSAIQKRQ